MVGPNRHTGFYRFPQLLYPKSKGANGARELGEEPHPPHPTPARIESGKRADAVGVLHLAGAEATGPL